MSGVKTIVIEVSYEGFYVVRFNGSIIRVAHDIEELFDVLGAYLKKPKELREDGHNQSENS